MKKRYWFGLGLLALLGLLLEARRDEERIARMAAGESLGERWRKR